MMWLDIVQKGKILENKEEERRIWNEEALEKNMNSWRY